MHNYEQLDPDAQAAFFDGMRHFRGDNPEELGITFDPELAGRQHAAGRQVARLLEGNRDNHDAWIDSLHLTHPQKDGPLRVPTPEERAYVSQQVARLRAEIKPTKHGS